jgi:inhibitor of KinA sporulation pathway (predicted exonuclease)
VASSLHKTSKHVELIFDASVMHIENDVSRKYADLEALFEGKNYQELQSNIETEIGNLQSRLSDIDASHGVEANYWERIELFVKLSERCKKILKVSQEKVWEVERKIDLVAQLRDTLDKAYKNQKKYIDDTLTLYYRLTNITIEKELTNVIPNLATNLEHSMCGVFSTLMTKIVDDPYNISKIEIDIDIRKKFKKEEEVTYNRFDANLIDKLQESLKTHIQGYMNDNLAPVVETLCKELKPIQRLSDDNDQDLKRKINKQIKKIDRHISNVTAKLQTTAHHYRAILHGVSQKVNLTFACVEKGIIYERYHSKYLKDPIDSFRRVFCKPLLQHLIWEPASRQLAQVEKIFTEVYSLIQNYQHCTYSYMTTYFSYDYIKNYIQDRCKGDGGKFDG